MAATSKSFCIQAFITGAVFSVGVFLLLARVERKEQEKYKRCEDSQDVLNHVAKQQNQLMDSVELDQRMLRKAEGAILNRTSRLIIVVERCTNDHNYSAILRTAEALGVQHVYIIAPQCIQSTLEISAPNEEKLDKEKEGENTKLKRSSGQVVKRATESEKKDRAMHHLFARKATEWLTVTEFDNTKSCIQALKEEGRHIWVTDLSQVATCLTEDGIRAHLNSNGLSSFGGKLIPEKVAIVFGTEAVGCTKEMLDSASVRVYLPLRGFADSLNLSVATALVVHQMFTLDPSLVGAMSEEERKALRQLWYPKLASQRLMTSREKKERGKLMTFISSCDDIGEKIANGEKLDPFEKEKWNKMKVKKEELDAIDSSIAKAAQKAVADLVENPPAPITDMRRADEHRTCFVGKNTKKMYGEKWADMPATANLQNRANSTSSFFRQRANMDS